jgi:phosphoribosyl 1,2-cyclic phosphodiesterase
MTLHTIGSGSKGNSYILQSSTGETLLLECGVRFAELKKVLNFDLSGIVGCIQSHIHGDHAKYTQDFAKCGIDVYSNDDTIDSLKFKSHRLNKVQHGKAFKLGSFTIKPYEVKHDVKCFSFLIHHKECGVTYFVTDTYYIPWKFTGLENIIIEANYDQRIIDEKLKTDMKFLRDRILKSHLSIDNCIGFLKANDLSKVHNIILVHLSDSNSNEADFIQRVINVTGKTVYAANSGQKIEFNKTPF